MFGGVEVWQITSSKVVGEKSLANGLGLNGDKCLVKKFVWL